MEELEIKNFVNYNEKTISEFSEIIKKTEDRNKQDSNLFNPMRFFGIGEVTHSLLLSKLLDPDGEHGQKDLFLKAFLRQICIDCEHKGSWTVTAEKGRMDVLIKYKKPSSVIIIENKSHHAADQKNQLFKYWYRELFIPNANQDVDYTLGKNKGNYRLIYLVSDDNKEPKNHSKERHIGADTEKYKDLKQLKKLNDEWVDIMSFDKDIVKWLETCLKSDSLDKTNYRIREYLKQYTELCENINNKQWRKNL